MASNESGSNLKEPGQPNPVPAELDQQDPVPEERPPPITIADRPTSRGRSLIATRHIEPGEVLFIDSPTILYPTSLSCIGEFCSHCFRVLPSESFHICKTCNMARFCSLRCLSSSHPSLVCQALPSLFSTPFCPSELLFLLHAYDCSPKVLLEVLSLHSISSFSPFDNFVRNLNQQIYPFLPKDKDKYPQYFSREITAHLLSVEKTNSFPIFTPTDPKFDDIDVGEVRARGIYYRSSFFNHDCMPNACPFNYIDEPGRENNTSLIFRAMHRILEGTEICISYVPLNMDYQEAQVRLLDDYGFDCNCVRCSIEGGWEENRSSAEEYDVKESEEEKMQWLKHKEVLQMPEEKMDRKGKGVLLEMLEEKVDRKGKGKLLEMPEEMVDRKGKGKLLEMPEEKVDRKGKGKLLEMPEEVVDRKGKGKLLEMPEEKGARNGKRKGAPGMPQGAGNFAPHIVYFARHMCDCGGCLAPFPASDARALLYSKECNKCGNKLTWEADF